MFSLFICLVFRLCLYLSLDERVIIENYVDEKVLRRRGILTQSFLKYDYLIYVLCMLQNFTDFDFVFTHVWFLLASQAVIKISIYILKKSHDIFVSMPKLLQNFALFILLNIIGGILFTFQSLVGLFLMNLILTLSFTFVNLFFKQQQSYLMILLGLCQVIILPNLLGSLVFIEHLFRPYLLHRFRNQASLVDDMIIPNPAISHPSNSSEAISLDDIELYFLSESVMLLIPNLMCLLTLTKQIKFIQGSWSKQANTPNGSSAKEDEASNEEIVEVTSPKETFVSQQIFRFADDTQDFLDLLSDLEYLSNKLIKFENGEVVQLDDLKFVESKKRLDKDFVALKFGNEFPGGGDSLKKGRDRNVFSYFTSEVHMRKFKGKILITTLFSFVILFFWLFPNQIQYLQFAMAGISFSLTISMFASSWEIYHVRRS